MPGCRPCVKIGTKASPETGIGIPFRHAVPVRPSLCRNSLIRGADNTQKRSKIVDLAVCGKGFFVKKRKQPPQSHSLGFGQTAENIPKARLQTNAGHHAVDPHGTGLGPILLHRSGKIESAHGRLSCFEIRDPACIPRTAGNCHPAPEDEKKAPRTKQGAQHHRTGRYFSSRATNCLSQAGCAGHAGAVTKLPSVSAASSGMSAYSPPASPTSGAQAG